MTPRRRDQPSIAAVERVAARRTRQRRHGRVPNETGWRRRCRARWRASSWSTATASRSSGTRRQPATDTRGTRMPWRRAPSPRCSSRPCPARPASVSSISSGRRPPSSTCGRSRSSDDGLSLGAVVLIHDVSEIHRVESVRRDFVANVSHELKTPIGGLALLAETLASETKASVIRPLAEQMVKEAERLGRIVDDLLDLSIIETQASRARPGPRGRADRGGHRAHAPRRRRGTSSCRCTTRPVTR